jgi:hypothetical protein
VSKLVFSGVLEIVPPPARLLSGWRKDLTLHLCLEPCEVDELSLVRARTRWPDYSMSVHAVDLWVRSLGLQELLTNCDVTLMANRGAQYYFETIPSNTAVWPFAMSF